MRLISLKENYSESTPLLFKILGFFTIDSGNFFRPVLIYAACFLCNLLFVNESLMSFDCVGGFSHRCRIDSFCVECRGSNIGVVHCSTVCCPLRQKSLRLHSTELIFFKFKVVAHTHICTVHCSYY